MNRFALLICVMLLWLVPSAPNAQEIVAETFMIPAADPGVQLFYCPKQAPHTVALEKNRMYLIDQLQSIVAEHS